MLKVPLFDCAINENCFFFRPHHGAFGAQVSQPPGICSSKQGKNNAYARGGGVHIVEAFRSARARCPNFL